MSHSLVVSPGLSAHECGSACSTSHRLARPSPPAASLPQVLSAGLPISAPPAGLDECFFFKSLVVRLPYGLIFWQFCCFLFLNLLLSFFWLCKEAQCIYLHLHLARKSPCELKKNVYPVVIQCKVRSSLLIMWFRSLISVFIFVYLIYF